MNTSQVQKWNSVTTPEALLCVPSHAYHLPPLAVKQPLSWLLYLSLPWYFLFMVGFPSISLVLHIKKWYLLIQRFFQHSFHFPVIYWRIQAVLLVVYFWCSSVCYSFSVFPKNWQMDPEIGLDSGSVPFRQDQKRHITSNCLSFCGLRSHWCSPPVSTQSVGIMRRWYTLIL